MTSIARQIRRRTTKAPSGKPQPYIALPDGGYMALHPTRGWRRFSAARLRAGAMIAHFRDLAHKRQVMREQARRAELAAQKIGL